jgi:hypothetical protein
MFRAACFVALMCVVGADVDDCSNATTACECADLGEETCGWSRTIKECQRGKVTDCSECASMAICTHARPPAPEKLRSDALLQFEHYSDRAVLGSNTYVLPGEASREECAFECLVSVNKYSFACHSFDYQRKDQICVLAAAVAPVVASDNGYDLYLRKGLNVTVLERNKLELVSRYTPPVRDAHIPASQVMGTVFGSLYECLVACDMQRAGDCNVISYKEDLATCHWSNTTEPWSAGPLIGSSLRRKKVELRPKGAICHFGEQCEGRVCDNVGRCSHCEDGSAGPCPDGEACNSHAHCRGNMCLAGPDGSGLRCASCGDGSAAPCPNKNVHLPHPSLLAPLCLATAVLIHSFPLQRCSEASHCLGNLCSKDRSCASCGDGSSAPCPLGDKCHSHEDCAGKLCLGTEARGYMCVGCSDGSSFPCVDGSECFFDQMCTGGLCMAKPGARFGGQLVCRACPDGSPAPCADGTLCTNPSMCAGNRCVQLDSKPAQCDSCADGSAAPCVIGSPCTFSLECGSNFCYYPPGKPASCSQCIDGSPPPCADESHCNTDTDCKNACVNGICGLRICSSQPSLPMRRNEKASDITLEKYPPGLDCYWLVRSSICRDAAVTLSAESLQMRNGLRLIVHGGYSTAHPLVANLTAPGTTNIEAIGSLLVHLHTGESAGSDFNLAVGFECPVRGEIAESVNSSGTCVQEYHVQPAADANICLERGLAKECADGNSTETYRLVEAQGRRDLFRLQVGRGSDQCLLAGRGAREGPCTASRALMSSTRVEDGSVRLHAPGDTSNCLMINNRVVYAPCPEAGNQHLFRFLPVLSSICPGTQLRLHGGGSLTTCISAGASPEGTVALCEGMKGTLEVLSSLGADGQVELVIRDGDECLLPTGLWGSCEAASAFSIAPLRGSVQIKIGGRCLTLMPRLERVGFVDCDEESPGQRFQFSSLISL